MADPLITLETLALATQSDEATVLADPFALWVITDLSDYARHLAAYDGSRLDETDTPILWTEANVPYDVKRAVLMAAKRTYKNPDAEVQTTVGPIGSRILEEEAIVNAFTESELEAIQGYNPDGPDARLGLWVQPTARGEDPLPVAEVLYVPDDEQINIETTNAWPSWDIPMFSPGDPGGGEG